MGSGTWTTLVVTAVAWLVLGAGAGAHASTPVRALSDDLAFTDSRPGQRNDAFREARRAGARVVRITLDWSLVAPGGGGKPAGFEPSSPSDPAYRWGYVEDAVRDAAARRLRVLLVVVRAPDWAQTAGRPDPAALGDFTRAAARRFSGFYPDPKHPGDGLTKEGRSLPAVRLWQVWERANAGGAGPVDHYRRMLRASARALNRVDAANVVVAGGTTSRDAPRFWRDLRGARFDVAAHSGPSTLGRVRRVLGRKPAWLTEVARETPPLSSDGVSPIKQAHFLVRAVYLADQAGAELFSWRGLQDRTTHLTNFPSIASGLFFNHTNRVASDLAKPARRAFRFPFLVRGSRAWGIAPRGRAAVAIDRRGARGWHRVGVVPTARSGEFSTRVGTGGGRYRARLGQARSLPWTR